MPVKFGQWVVQRRATDRGQVCMPMADSALHQRGCFSIVGIPVQAGMHIAWHDCKHACQGFHMGGVQVVPFDACADGARLPESGVTDLRQSHATLGSFSAAPGSSALLSIPRPQFA